MTRVFRQPTRLLVVVGLAVTGWFAVAAIADGRDTTALRISADFADASPLLEGNNIQLNGVQVGTIDSMENIDGGARLELKLNEEALPVYKDAKLSSRPLSLLGERYLDLDPGTPEAGELRDGDRLDAAQTGSATDLDEVLNVLDQPTSQSLAGLVTTLGVGLDGNGQNVADALRALQPALADTDALAQVLRTQNSTLSSLVESLEPVAQGVAADNGKALDGLVASADDMLRATADNEAAFRSLLSQLPGTLTSATTTLAELEGTARSAVPTLDALQPLTGDLDDVSGELMQFLDTLDPALTSAEPVLDKADELISAAMPVAQQLRAQGDDLVSVSQSADPLTATLAPDFTTVMEFFRGWALATNGRDGLAHYFRAGFVVTPYTLTGLIPSTDGTRPDTTFDPMADEPALDAAGSGGPLGSATAGLPGLLAPTTTADGGVTGLSPQQEQGILTFLLGGI